LDLEDEAPQHGGFPILDIGQLSEIDPTFKETVMRGLGGERLRVHEVETLLRARGRELPILTLAADALRGKIVGDAVTYVVNRNINFTNACNCKCAFCGFARGPGDPDAYLLSMEQIRDKVRQAKAFGATEICIQGGISPEMDIRYLVDLLRAVKKEMPGVHIHGFSPMEIDHVAGKAGLPVKEVLTILSESGLDSMPGTAAEILVDRVRKIICPNKISSDRWEEIVVTAHRMGIHTTSTMMYGTVETLAERARHLVRIRTIQESTQGFTEFVPLPFIHGLSPISPFLAGGPSGADDIRTIAAARLTFGPMLPNIQVSWVKMGKKLAQVALTCGANDFGGTLMEENISRSAGGSSGTFMTPAEIRQLIIDLGRTPAQRDTLYRIVG
jgi:FO synthase subunit 2